MERVWPLTCRARRVLATGLVALAGASSGCTTTDFATLQQSLIGPAAPEPSQPASEFACAWQNRLSTLPDPTRNGAMIPGVAGQVFLYNADCKPADPNGDLMLTVHDTTPRPPGVSPMRAEVWHFTRDVLRRMVTSDDRFGRSLVVFLPWPEHWRDVNRLSIQARYDQPGGQTLFAQPATVTFDFSAPGSGPVSLTTSLPTVPDPAAMLRQTRAAAAAQQTVPPPNWGIPAAGVPPTTQAPVAYAYPPPAAARQTQPVSQPPMQYPQQSWSPPQGMTVMPHQPQTQPMQPMQPAVYQPSPGWGYQPPASYTPPQTQPMVYSQPPAIPYPNNTPVTPSGEMMIPRSR